MAQLDAAGKNAAPGFALNSSILVAMPEYDETLDIHSVNPGRDDGGITYARIPNPPAQPQAQPQQQPVPVVAASPQPGPAPVPLSPGTAVDWGVLGTSAAGLAWLFSQVGPYVEDAPVG